MESEEAAELFRELPKDERTNVALEMGKLHDLPLELVEKIGYNLAEKARNVPDEGTVGVDGIKFIADVLSDLDNTTRDELINGMRTTDVKMTENIESNCFIFDSLPEVPKDILQEVVRRLQPETVITAISGSNSKIKESAIMCFPEKSRAALVSSLKTKTPSNEEIRSSELEALFEANEAVNNDIQDTLNERLGALKELFGVMQQVAGDARTRFDNSITNVQYPDRTIFLEFC